MSRSGSTLLSRILGEFSGCFNAGEVIEIWERALLNNCKCSCGKPFRSCYKWKPVIEKILGETNTITLNKIYSFQKKAAHSSRTLLRTFLSKENNNEMILPQYYAKNILRLYNTIAKENNAQIIIDSSKNVGYAKILSLLPEIELYNLHLIRDPRAVVYSWKRKKSGLHQESVIKMAITWNIRNLALINLSRRNPDNYFLLYYEKFINNPGFWLEKIKNFMNLDKPLSFLSKNNSVLLSTSHSIYGNPNRFGQGHIQLRLDKEWYKLGVQYKALVFAISFLLMRRYNYPLKI